MLIYSCIEFVLGGQHLSIEIYNFILKKYFHFSYFVNININFTNMTNITKIINLTNIININFSIIEFLENIKSVW